MRIPRIYTPQPLGEKQNLILDDAASHHVSRVLRMQMGRELIVFNGEGGEYPAIITAISKRQVEIQTSQFSDTNRCSPLEIELAIGLSKGDKMDWVVQKACELGVSTITPLMCERSEVRLSAERSDKKIAHWKQIIISACEQSQRNLLPKINEITPTSQFYARCDAELKLVLHHRASHSLSELAQSKQQACTSIAILIGPEGGLSDDEIVAAQHSDFKALLIGPRVLRTETAPLAALSLLQYLWGDF